MKTAYTMLSLLCVCGAATAQTTQDEDSTDVFFRHLNLNEVTVTGLTGQTKLKELPTPVTLISAKDLRQTAASNLVDAIARQPGVSQLTTGSGIAKPVIRGLGYNRIVTVNDGVRQEGQQWGDEHGIEIDAASVGSVEILKGPASLMYGSDAMAGVVIFHPAPFAPKGKTVAEAGTEYQTNNGLFAYSAHVGGNQQLVWNAHWSQKLAHAYKNKQDGYVPGSQFREHAASAMAGLSRQWGHSLLRLGYYSLTPGIVEGGRDPMTGELEAEAPLKTYGHPLPFQRVNHYKAVWDNALNLGDDSQLKAIIGYQQNQRKEFEESPTDYELYFLLHTVTYDLRFTHEWASGWKLAAGVGGMYQQSLNKGEEALIPAYNLFDAGLYATATKTIADRLTVSGGLRADRRWLHSKAMDDEEGVKFTDFHRQFDGLTGSLGAVWNLAKQFDMRLNLSRGFRAPNLSELGSNGVHEGTIRYEIGNSQLKAEHSQQADLGLDFNSPFVSAQLTMFANRISNYIFAARTPETMEEGYLTYTYRQGDATLTGFEAAVDCHPVHRLHLGTTFSYVNAVQKDQPEETKYLPMTPAPRWTADVKWELTQHADVHEHRYGHSQDKHWLLPFNAYVAAGMECYLKQNHYYRADETETATPSYTLLNLTAGTDLLIRGRKVAELSLTVQNLTNRAYQSHLSRLKYTDENSVTGQRGICNMGRNIVVKLTLPILQ